MHASLGEKLFILNVHDLILLSFSINSSGPPTHLTVTMYPPSCMKVGRQRDSYISILGGVTTLPLSNKLQYASSICVCTVQDWKKLKEVVVLTSTPSTLTMQQGKCGYKESSGCGHIPQLPYTLHGNHRAVACVLSVMSSDIHGYIFALCVSHELHTSIDSGGLLVLCFWLCFLHCQTAAFQPQCLIASQDLALQWRFCCCLSEGTTVFFTTVLLCVFCVTDRLRVF